MTAWWQHAVSKSETLLLLQKGRSFETGRQSSPRSRHNVTNLFWQHAVTCLTLVGNTVILQCFDAVGWATGRASGSKNFLLQNLLYDNQSKRKPENFPVKWPLNSVCVCVYCLCACVMTSYINSLINEYVTPAFDR